MIDTTQVRKWSFADINLLGTSWAGIGTCMVWPELGVVFDVAQGLPVAFNQPFYLISHGHMDHAGGIPYLISQKALARLPTPKFFMPKELVEPMGEILAIWQKIEGYSYRFIFEGVEPGQDYPLKGAYFFRAFATPHRVPSLGYTIFRRRKRLKLEFAGLAQEQLVDLRRKGIEIETEASEPLLTFTGDTKIEFLDGPDWAKQARVVVTEVTYIDQNKTIEATREWGHIHLDELLPRLNELECERLLLIHLSSRHGSQELRRALQQRLPEAWQGRVEVFARE